VPAAAAAGWYALWRPVVDRGMAFIAFVLFLPLLVVAAVLIKLTSRGPAMYRQTRTGKDGAPFTLYKLRTMYDNAEAETGAVWSARGDRRVTPVGRVLRARHLDELPQLINVLRGEMSLIGPRPERPEIVEFLRLRIEGYLERLRVPPGITGMAQIELPPDVDLPGVREKLVRDVYYINHRGASLDFRIFCCTALFLVGVPLRVSRRMLRVGAQPPALAKVPTPDEDFQLAAQTD
jgi:lipopolysaccharide/colanic/teichoic acid biosynthesis glycosyltransferase